MSARARVTSVAQPEPAVRPSDADIAAALAILAGAARDAESGDDDHGGSEVASHGEGHTGRSTSDDGIADADAGRAHVRADARAAARANADARVRAFDTLAALPPDAALAVLLPWIGGTPGTGRVDVAVELLGRHGAAVVVPMTALLEGEPTPHARLLALRVLDAVSAEWCGRPVARRIAEAAWSQAEAVDREEALFDDEDVRHRVLEVVERSGREGADVVDRVVARMAEDPEGPWASVHGFFEPCVEVAAPRIDGP